MIFGHISQPDKCVIPASILTALEFLTSRDLDNLETGRHDINGDLMFVNVMSFDTVHEDEKLAEVHKEYIDLQVLIHGEEKIQAGFDKITNKHNQATVELEKLEVFVIISLNKAMPLSMS